MSFSANVSELVETSEAALVQAAPGWPRVPLGCVATIQNGFPFKSEYFQSAGGDPLIRIRDVTSGRTETRYAGPPVDGYWVAPGDLIVGMDGDFNCRIWGSERGLLNQRVCKITPDARVLDLRFLAFLLPGYLRLINEATHSVTVKHLSSKTLQEIPLPLPPLAEQRRIVAKLDALTTRTDRARADLDRIPALAGRYKQAVLEKAFSGEMIPLQSVAETVTIEGVAAHVFDGPFGSNLRSADYVPAGVRVVRLENIGHLEFIEHKETYITEAKFDGLRRHSLQSDDVLFSSFVDEQVRVCVLPELATPAINKADCFCVRLDRSRCDPRFLAFRLASRSTFEHFEAQVHGATRPRINLRQLKAFEFHLPPLHIQEEIVRRIDTAFAEIDRLTTEAAAARRLLDRLDQAILAKAFRGELVPQDPADEPASVLLERIRAERAAAPKARRGRKAAA